MSICVVIQHFLSTDVVNSDPSVVLSRNSSTWSNVGDLPLYTWTSLGTLWMGRIVSSTELITRLNYQFGEGEFSAEGEISLLTRPIESVRIPEAWYSNDAGAETTYLDMVLRQPENEMSVARMMNVELRLRYLLDNKWRATRRGGGVYTSPNIPNSGDTSISQDMPILCQWMNYLTEPTAVEMAVRYVVSYQRNVPK